MRYTENIPDYWTLNSDEIAPYVFKLVAVANDGRRIESTGSDEDNLRAEIVASIKESDEQVERLRQARSSTPNGQ